MSIFLTSCEIVQDFEHSNFKTNEEFKAFILNICSQYKTIKKMCAIIHDQDIVNEYDKNNNIIAIRTKRKHYHIYLKFQSSKDVDLIASWFGVPSNMINKIEGSFRQALAYATHRNAPTKHQYQLQDLILYNMSVEDYDQMTESVSASDWASVVEPLLTHYMELQLNDIDLIEQLSSSQRLKYFSKIQQCRKIRLENSNTRTQRNIKVLYFFGESGSGKTTYAKYLGEKLYHNPKQVCISSSSNDPLQDYLGQKILVLDDFRPETMIYADFLKMLDNNTNSTVKSRFLNKCIYDVELIIITTQVAPHLLYNTNENMIQLLRRLDFTCYYFDKDGVYEIRYDTNGCLINELRTLILSSDDLQKIIQKSKGDNNYGASIRDLLF